MHGAGGPSSPARGPGLPAGFLCIDTRALVLPRALMGDRRLLIWENCADLGGTQTSCLGEPRSQMPPRELGRWEVNPLFEDLSPGQAVCVCFHWAEGILGAHEGTSRAHGPTCYVAGGQLGSPAGPPCPHLPSSPPFCRQG